MKTSPKSSPVVVRMGIDTSKNLFQLHGVDAHEKVVLRRRVSRKLFLQVLATMKPCKIGMEACGASHHWARELRKLGHEVRLMAAQHVKPYVQNNKNDARDAEAICEAVSRPRMRFVEVKSIEQQDIQALHRVRQGLVKSRTALSNQIRGLLAEYGIVVKKGASYVRTALPTILEDADNRLTAVSRELMADLYQRLCLFDREFDQITARITNLASTSPQCRNLCTIGGIGPIAATALYASVGNGSQFKCGRDMAAWLGLVPRQYSTAGREVNLGISKKGNRYIRALLVHGGRTMVQHCGKKDDPHSLWLQKRKCTGGNNKAAVAAANKIARVAWALLRTNQPYKQTAAKVAA